MTQGDSFQAQLSCETQNTVLVKSPNFCFVFDFFDIFFNIQILKILFFPLQNGDFPMKNHYFPRKISKENRSEKKVEKK